MPYGDPQGRFVLHGGGAFEEAIRTDILTPCMRFIERFCVESWRNQEAVFPHLHVVMACMGHGIGATSAAAAVLHDNESLCLQLSERAIHNVVDMIAGTKNGSRVPRRKPHYLKLLRGVCVVGGKVMAQNQMYVLKYLSENGPIKLEPPMGGLVFSVKGSCLLPEAALVLFRGREGREQRASLVQAGEGASSGGLLEYNIEMLRLLEALLMDYNPDAYSRVQLMLPPEKICEDVCSDDCLPEAKAQLLNLMRLLYLSQVSHI